MPDLNCMRCTIEIGPNHEAVQELGVSYSNQRVQCYVGVPNTDVAFCIRFETSSYISPGLAVFVFIDGQYQANRNFTRPPLQLVSSSTVNHKIDECIRQKEEFRTKSDLMIGRAWHFSKIKTFTSGDVPHVDRSLLENLGTIEVIVLRCTADDPLRPFCGTDIPSFDGASDNKEAAVHYGNTAMPLAGTQSSHQPHHDRRHHSAHSRGHKSGNRPHTDIRGVGDAQTYSAWKASKSANAKAGQNYAKWATHKSAIAKAAADLDSSSWRDSIYTAGSSNIWKSHWKSWKSGRKGYGDSTEKMLISESMAPKDPYLYPAYDQPLIHAGYAASRDLSVQVTTGKGALYYHSHARPIYLDTMESPFAVFVFYYRDEQDIISQWKALNPNCKTESTSKHSEHKSRRSEIAHQHAWEKMSSQLRKDNAPPQDDWAKPAHGNAWPTHGSAAKTHRSWTKASWGAKNHNTDAQIGWADNDANPWGTHKSAMKSQASSGKASPQQAAEPWDGWVKAKHERHAHKHTSRSRVGSASVGASSAASGVQRTVHQWDDGNQSRARSIVQAWPNERAKSEHAWGGGDNGGNDVAW
ncbi:hypothetical protein ANO11243_021860 [Dothideomycetidae sp. 11243]|nr:hypothetical protein ANO11243_021860 [fungal sp. No.11243]